MDKRPESLKRITTKKAAEKFIDQQVKQIPFFFQSAFSPFYASRSSNRLHHVYLLIALGHAPWQYVFRMSRI